MSAGPPNDMWDREVELQDLRYDPSKWELTGEERSVQPGEYCIVQERDGAKIWKPVRTCRSEYLIIRPKQPVELERVA